MKKIIKKAQIIIISLSYSFHTAEISGNIAILPLNIAKLTNERHHHTCVALHACTRVTRIPEKGT